MDNDIPAWKNKTSVIATDNLKGGTLAGKFLATKLKAGDTLGILEAGAQERPYGHLHSSRRPTQPHSG